MKNRYQRSRKDFYRQFAYTYSKYETEINLKDNPVTSWDLLEYFNFQIWKH
jgi:hypothetical protein